MSYLDILDRITDDFGKHRLTDVMEEENEDDGRFSNSRNRFSSIGSTASSIDHLWDIHPRRLSEAGLSSHADSSAVLTEDTDSFIIGQKVWVSGTKPGHIAFIGETQFAPGEWAGIALDEPIGKNDGSVGGIRYFMCEPKKGVFARLTRLTRFPLAQEGMGSGETYVTHSPVGNGVRKSPISPTGSTRGTMKSPSSINGSNLSLYSSASHVIDYKLGDRVIIKSSQGSKVGMVRYIGTTDFATGEWVGVELDEPRGKNDGSVNGKRYFECRPNFGLFAPASKVSKSPSKVKPSSCQIHSSSSGLPPSGILKRTNSKESMLSNISMTSVTSSARRVRLGVTSLTPKKPPLKASPAPIPTRTALQDVLKEKQLHIEQLLKERDLERAEITKAANQTEEAEQRLTVLRQEYDKYRSECEVQLQEHISLLNKLKADRNELVAQFDEEKRKSEDLAFRLAESSIFKEDVEVANENNLKRIKELEEKLQKERDKVETLESDANKLFEAEENLIRAKEEIESLRNQLQETRGKQQILEGDNASTSVLISSLQKEVDQYKRDVEERDEMISVLKQEITKVTTDFKKQMGETVNQKTEIEALCIVKDEEIAKIKLEVEQVNKLLQNKIIELEKITNEKLSSESVFEKQLDKLKMELSSKSYNQETIAQECKEKDDAISELKKQLEVVKIQIQEKSSEFEVLKTELSKQISERNNVIDEYKLQTSKLQENITMLNSDLEKTNLNWQTTVTDTTKRFTDIIEDKTLRINELELQAQDVTKENITANQKLEELNKNFDSKCGELDSLKIQNENLVKECNDLKMNVAELQKDSDSLKGKESLIQTLQTELQTTKVDLESVSSNLSQYQTNMSDVESSLKKERDELKESLKAKIVELEDAKKVFSDSIALKEEELKELSVTLSKKTTDADKLQKDFEISKEKTDNYIQEIVQKHVSEVKSKEEELTGIMNELNVKVKQVNDFEVEVKELREQLIQKSSEYQKLSEEMESKMKDNSSQLTVILTAQNEVEQFKKATEQLEIKCGDLTKTNIELEDSNRKQNDLIDLKAKEIEQYEIITKQKTDEINFLKSELSTTNERLGNTIKELENYQSNLSDVETNLKKEKNDLQNALDAKNLELGTIKQEMTDKISLLEKTLSEFNLNNELKSQEIADLTAKNIAIWTEIKNLTCNTFNFFNESPPTREHDLSMLSDCLNKWQDHVKARECTINELQESLKLSTNKLTDNDSKIPELEHKIQEITKLSQETKKSLDQVQNENEMLKLELSNKSEASVHYNDKISSLTKLIEDKEKALLTLNSDFQAKVEVLENTIKELNENKSELQLSIQKQKDEYDDIIKTISDSETDLRNRIESNKDSDRVKELESKLSEIITKLGEKDKIIFSQNEELAKTKDELSKIKSLHNGLNQPSISVQPDSNQTNESPKYQQLLEEKIFAESQVAFLNSIIVDMQKKNETQQARIEILEMGYNATAADELVSLGFIRGEKIPAPRMYCDICEEFDLHETEDCPTQADDEQPNVKLVHQDQKEKPLPRPYCEICEEFSHATEDCTNVDQEF